MALCRALGCTLGELWRRMTAAEADLWRMAWHERPWGDHAVEIMIARLCHIAASWRGGDWKPGDFMIRQKRERPNWREMRNRMSRYRVMMGNAHGKKHR